MATTTLELPRMSADDRKELWANIAAMEGVRSVKDEDDGARLVIDYDDTVIGANRFQELLTEQHPDIGIPLGPGAHPETRIQRN